MTDRTTDRTSENGFIHPTGVAPAPVVTRTRAGLTVEAGSVEEALSALGREPLVTGNTGPLRFTGRRWPGGRCTVVVRLAQPRIPYSSTDQPRIPYSSTDPLSGAVADAGEDVPRG